MWAVFKKELFSYFYSQVAYIIIGVFLTACGLMFWFFPDSSILEYGYAEMNGFFALSPYLFMFLVSAITMRSFAEERKEGTFILLATRPISDLEIILSKYLAALVLVLLALVPTLVYYYSVYQLGMPKGNIDSGAVIGSYLGLILLASAYTALGVFASSLNKNQMVAFAISLLLCFLFFISFDAISKITVLSDYGFIQYLGIYSHYQSISRGVLDSRDVVYFLSLSILFLWLTKMVIGGRKW